MKKISKTRSSSNMSKNAMLSASGWNPKLHNYHPPLTMIKKCNIASSNPNWFEIIGLCIIRNNHIGGMKMLQFQSNFFIANHFHLLPATIITLLMTSIIHFDTANNFALQSLGLCSLTNGRWNHSTHKRSLVLRSRILLYHFHNCLWAKEVTSQC